MMKLKTILKFRKYEILQFLEKKCIIKSLVMTNFMYVAYVLPLPDDNFIQNVKRSIFNLNWNKTDRIKRNTIIGTICGGGVAIYGFELKWCNIGCLLKLSETNVKKRLHHFLVYPFFIVKFYVVSII